MMEPLASETFTADTTPAAARRIAVWWAGLVTLFTLAAAAAAVALGLLVPALESRLEVIADTARERAAVEESADLAARMADMVSAEGRRAVQQNLIGQITILERMRAQHATTQDAPPDYRSAWHAPDGAFYRYVQSLRTLVSENAALMLPIAPIPDEAFALIDQTLVLQNQRTRTLMMLSVAAIGVALGLAVVAGILSLPLGLRPVLATLHTAHHDEKAKVPLAPPAQAPPRGVCAEMVAHALDQCQPMILITSSTGTIEYANASFLAHNGYTSAEVVGQPVRILSAGVSPRGTHRRVWETLLDGTAWTGEFCNRRRDGSCYWAQTTITPVRDETGRVVRFIAVEQDMAQPAGLCPSTTVQAEGPCRGSESWNDTTIA